MANISAQDTTPLHASSTEFLIVSITSNPLTEFKLGVASFSLSSSPSSKIEPSQPWKPNILDILFYMEKEIKRYVYSEVKINCVELQLNFQFQFNHFTYSQTLTILA